MWDDMPPGIPVTVHSGTPETSTGRDRPGFIPPLGAHFERAEYDPFPQAGAAQFSSAWPPVPAPSWPAPSWPVQPLPWDVPRRNFDAPLPAAPQSNWSLASTCNPTPLPESGELTPGARDPSCTLGSGGHAQGSTLGWPITSIPWGCNPIPPPPLNGFDGCGDRLKPQWHAAKPSVERRRRRLGCTNPPAFNAGGLDQGFNRSEISDQTFRYGRRSPSVASFRSVTPLQPPLIPPPLDFRFEQDSGPQYPPPFIPAPPSWVNDPENFSNLRDSRAYVAIDPFVASVAQSVANRTSSSEPTTTQPPVQPLVPVPPPTSPTQANASPNVSISRYIFAFLFDIVPRQIYLHLLFTIPVIYFSRVARIFEESGLSMMEIRKMASTFADDGGNYRSNGYDRWGLPAPASDPQATKHLKASWEHLVDSLMKEWKALNLVSVLLSFAITITLQIEGALTDSYIRNFALLSLICSLMGLSYGCLYVIKFDAIRTPQKAVEWAEEAQKRKTSIFWNVWVLLAMPVVSLLWSVIFYLTCVIALVWRTTKTTNDPVLGVTLPVELDPRIAITFMSMLGLVYFCLIIRDFRRNRETAVKTERKKALEMGEPSWNMPGVKDPGFARTFKKN